MTQKSMDELAQQYLEKLALGYPGAHDYFLTHLEEGDLQKLVELCVVGVKARNPEFRTALPFGFWSDYLLPTLLHSGPGMFWGNLYTFAGRIEIDDYADGEWMEYRKQYVDPNFRLRIEAIIKRWAQECLDGLPQQGLSIQGQARFVWDFLETVYWDEGENSPDHQMQQVLTGKGAMTLDEFGEGIAKVEIVDERDNPMLKLLGKLERNKRFRRLLKDIR